MLGWTTCFERGEIVHEWPTDLFRGVVHPSLSHKLTNSSRHVQWGPESTRFIDLALVGLESLLGGYREVRRRNSTETFRRFQVLWKCWSSLKPGLMADGRGKSMWASKIRGPFEGPSNQ